MSSARQLITEEAFILHHRPYRETSLLVEAFSPSSGRIGLVAKGVRGGRKGSSALLQPFYPLLLSWQQRGELATLTGVEARDRSFHLTGTATFSGFYLNELLMRLTERHDPHPELFHRYEATLRALSDASHAEWALRMFERDLLESLGYGLLLDYTAEGTPVEAQHDYCYHLEHGAVAATVGQGGIMISGTALLSLASGVMPEQAALNETKRLMRAALRLYLGNKPLQSRELFRQGIAAGLHLPGTDANLEE